MELTRQRAFLSPAPGEDWKAIAARVLPDEESQAAIEKLRGWNMHLFARNPPGEFTGSDVIFVEPPADPNSVGIPNFDGSTREPRKS